MTTQFSRAPHVGGDRHGAPAPNAALLIDFDNVTMGMRSDLSKDLRKLLQSDVIRGKVTVQRAYADWRRYPQYIVPLSENSIDLIFAPAYGSSKKNATDIRMAIDAIELVFTRPEIGTYILLTGDSDFSSCVLKLKEYGKYVIGVGIQESSSDILVQNCDEYYSYTSLAGLQKTTETDVKSMDPWVLVEKAVKKMADKGDVMRSDRLKQVMIDMDSSFSEGSYGFSKFSKFVTEAASRNLLVLKKMPNGQYEVLPPSGESSSRRKDGDEDRGRGRSRRDRDRRSGDRDGRDQAGGQPPAEPETTEADAAAPAQDSADGGESREAPAGSAREAGIEAAYDLLRSAMERLKEDGREPVRDSDVKRKMLELDPGFDESTLGFGKFSRFLRQAHDHEVVDLAKQDGGSYEVSLRSGAPAGRPARQRRRTEEPAATAAPETAAADTATTEPPRAEPPRDEGPVVEDLRPEDFIPADAGGRRLGPRGGTTRRRGVDDPPPLFEGQGRRAAGAPAASSEGREPAEATPAEPVGPVDLESLKLPQEPERMVRYLTHYKGVGEKTAQQVVDHFGAETFRVIHENPDALNEAVPAGRVDQLVAGWEDDLRRRASGEKPERRGGRRGGRGRRGGGGASRGGERGEG